MKNIEIIYQRLVNKCRDLPQSGFTAEELADELGLLRSNVSRELNKLYREGRIDKSVGRPVKYRIRVEGDSLMSSTQEAMNATPVSKIDNTAGKLISTAFDKLIGATRTLKTQVEQAKAAIIYPPHGLHSLIVGQTGVGKTLLAHMMFDYGKDVGIFASNAPFVTFNCADYYNNPQLLLSHIFGHVKGAFTGADKEHIGLIESANKGILFLDEIHRLPPEGQEMIFYFMDTHTYNRLGETKREREADVLIIGATTEDPDSVLTHTFKRRIPNIISLPPLSERSLKEKLDIVYMLFTEESRIIKKPVKVTLEALKAIIGSIGVGNVGQLKSNIRLLCAQSFLNGIQRDGHIEVNYKTLPPSIKSGILQISRMRDGEESVEQYYKTDLIIEPSMRSRLPSSSDKEPFNLYQMVENKADLLKQEGIAENLIQQIIVADVNAYVNSYYNQPRGIALSIHDRLLKIIDADMVEFAQEVVILVERYIKLISTERFLYAFGLHLSSLFNRVNDGKLLQNNLAGTVDKNSVEYKLASKIRFMIKQKYKLNISQSETEYFAMLLQSLKQENTSEKVVIIVAMHGEYTASSMVNVARKLFSVNTVPLLAFDMPLECNPDEMLNRILEQLDKIDCHKGILLLADMGSLCSFGPIIEERLHVPVRTLGMVSTPFVLEAMRKVDIAGVTLDAIYDSLKSFNGYEHQNEEVIEEKELAILTICSTGAGAAKKLQDLVQEVLFAANAFHIKVLPVSVLNLDEAVYKLAEKYQIIAAVGIQAPNMDIPFIPIEDMITGAAEPLIYKIIGKEPPTMEHTTIAEQNIVLQRLCLEGLDEMLTYLNPHKIVGSLLQCVDSLESKLQLQMDNAHKLRLAVHIACALERMVLQQGLIYDEQLAGPIDADKYEIVQDGWQSFHPSII